MAEAELQQGQVETRANEIPITDVSYPKRTVTVVVAPYETPAVISNGPGRPYTEIVSRSAYIGIERRAGSVGANRDHNWERLAGKVIRFDSKAEEGLVADVKMYNTDIGNETLEICADGGLFASAGFGLMREGEDGRVGPVKRGAETWEKGRTVRRLNSLWLDHVGFVPNPAFRDAVIKDVRSEQAVAAVVAAAAELTPNLDRLWVEQARAKLREIDIRYGV